MWFCVPQARGNALINVQQDACLTILPVERRRAALEAGPPDTFA